MRLDADRQAQIGARGSQDRSLLHAIDDLVTWHDRNGHVLKANAAAMKLVGAPASSLQGRGLFARVHVADRPAFPEGDQRRRGQRRADRRSIPPSGRRGE